MAATLAIAIGPLKSFNIPRHQQAVASNGTLQKRWASVGNVQDKEVSVDKVGSSKHAADIVHLTPFLSSFLPLSPTKVKKHKQHHLLSPPGVRKGFSFRRPKKNVISKDGKRYEISLLYILLLFLFMSFVHVLENSDILMSCISAVSLVVLVVYCML